MVKVAKQGSAKTSAQLLEEMVAEMARLGPGCEPETVEWGPDRGSEIIDDAYSRGEITMPLDDCPTDSEKTGEKHRLRQKSG
jgi:antitoxin MazE